MTNLDSLLSPEQANSIKMQIHTNPHGLQESAFKSLLATAKDTVFAKDHNFTEINSYSDFKNHVPVREYGDFQKYWDLIAKHECHVLWPEKPLFYATTSATTGFPKLIPVTKDSLASFIGLPIRAMVQYIYDTNDRTLLNYNFLHLTGVPRLQQINNYLTGSISGICRQMMPEVLLSNSLPSVKALELMVSDGWDAMFKQIALEVKQKPISLITGLPSWMMQFFIACSQLENKNNLSALMPHLKLLCTSGVSSSPYIDQIQRMFDQKLTFREFYSASEGSFAYQDSIYNKAMLLNLSDGIFFEFIELNDYHKKNPARFTIKDVKLETPYVPIISTRAGLWAYKTGDVVKFTSCTPYRIEFIGRTKHFISLANESVYAKNIEDALSEIANELGLVINNFTVAPNAIKEITKPYYIWYIELKEVAELSASELAFKLDYHLQKYSDSYANARKQSALAKPKVYFVKPGSFVKLLQQKDKSNLQLKVPKLQNDREIADFLIQNKLIIHSGVTID